MTRARRRGTVAIAGRVIAALSAALFLASAAPGVRYTDLATPFEEIATETAGQPATVRVATVRAKFDALLPGLYPAGAGTDRRIVEALAAFPAERAAYGHVVHDFSKDLSEAVARFRHIFPDFTSPLPIYLYNSLGQRDGGSDYLEPGHRHLMFFGADMIAEYHADDSLQPFLDHELFHLQHARSFSDCDQFWCTLWQEGLAVDAAAAMTPDATDHQLLLDIPAGIRGPTDARWADALCFVAAHFDDSHDGVAGQAFAMGGKPPSGLPDRFGYYLGYRFAQASGQSLPALARLDHQAAHHVLRSTLIRFMATAKVGCAPPDSDAAKTNRPPRAL